MPLTHLYTQFLPKEAVSLGRITLDLKSPEQDFHDSPALALFPVGSTQKHQVSFNDRWGANSRTDFRSSLASVFAEKLGNGCTENLVRLSIVSTYQLMNSGDMFEKICSVEDSRKWFERKVIAKDKKAYMMVGYETLGNSVNLQGSNMPLMEPTERPGASTAINAEVDPTNRQNLAAATVDHQYSSVYVTGGYVHQGDNQGIIHHHHYPQPSNSSPSKAETGKTEISLRPVGVQVCAVQYRQIQFKWFRSKDLGAARLQGGTMWKQYYGTREEADSEDEDEPDVIQAEVMDLATNAKGPESDLDEEVIIIKG